MYGVLVFFVSVCDCELLNCWNEVCEFWNAL
jgi:hypothetical protein